MNKAMCSAVALVFSGSALYAQDEINRTPVDDASFEIIADHFRYDRQMPLEAVTIG
ncbi:uncharacterized protein METZ01_LOCUS339523, partial [marine metagenome]